MITTGYDRGCGGQFGVTHTVPVNLRQIPRQKLQRIGGLPDCRTNVSRHVVVRCP